MLCILQSRLSSKRFPGKMMKFIKDKTLIELVVNRLKQSKKISKIVVATSINKTDKKLLSLLKKKKILFFKGSLNNVAARLHSAAKKHNAKKFVRISGDSPLIDPKLIDRIINFSKKKKFDLVTNTFPKTFPKGQSVEIINKESLKNILNKIKIKSEKENVTEYFYKNSKKYRIFNYKSKFDYSNISMTVDYKNDINKMQKIFKVINGKENFELIIKKIKKKIIITYL